MPNDWSELQRVALRIVDMATDVKNRWTGDLQAQVSWCCVFSRTAEEFDDFVSAVATVGLLAKETPNGPVYVIPALSTASGILRVLKIRSPDAARPERGDADFAASDYHSLRQRMVDTSGVQVLDRDGFEMMEIVEQGNDVRVYFSHPPVEQHAGIREALARWPGRSPEAPC